MEKLKLKCKSGYHNFSIYLSGPLATEVVCLRCNKQWAVFIEGGVYEIQENRYTGQHNLPESIIDKLIEICHEQTADKR